MCIRDSYLPTYTNERKNVDRKEVVSFSVQLKQSYWQRFGLHSPVLITFSSYSGANDSQIGHCCDAICHPDKTVTQVTSRVAMARIRSTDGDNYIVAIELCMCVCVFVCVCAHMHACCAGGVHACTHTKNVNSNVKCLSCHYSVKI